MSGDAGGGHPWTDGEDGPDCACGWPRVVKRLPDGRFVLMCFGHTGEAGAIWRLPEVRPDGWPALESEAS